MWRTTFVMASLLAFFSAVRAGAPTTSGTVVADGKPVSGVKVWLVYYFQAERPPVEKLIETETDTAGRFRVAEPKDELAQLDRVIARAADGRIGWLDFRWGEEDEQRNPRIELLPVGEARGRFTDTGGRPIAGVRVEIESLQIGKGERFRREKRLSIPKELQKLYQATSGEDGTFAVAGVPLGASLSGPVTATGVGDRRIGWTQETPGDFRLEKPGRVRVRLTGAADVKQLSGLPVFLFTMAQPFTPKSPQFVNYYREAKISGGDTLEFNDVLPGEGELRFYGASKIPWVLPKENAKVVVKPGELTEATVAVEPAARVRGRVIDQKTKAGIAGVSVIVNCQDKEGRHGRSAFVHTDGDGRFDAYVAPGWLSFSVRETPGYAPPLRERAASARVEVAARKEHTFADLALEPTVVLEGLVVDDKGQPVPNVQVRSTNTWMRWQEKPIRTNDLGRFVMKSFAASEATALRTRTDRAVTDGGVVVDMAQQKGAVKLVVSEKLACRLMARVVDAAGRPIKGASVRVIWYYRVVGSEGFYAGTTLETHLSGADGRFQTAALWPGDEYHVDVTADGFAKGESVKWKGQPGELRDFGEIRLTRTNVTVRGVVVDAAGRPLAGVTVFNHGDAPQPISTTTGADGRFQLSGLYDGPAYVFARKEGHRFTMARIEQTAPEVRITLLTADAAPPAAEQPIRSKEHVAAEEKLAKYLLDRLLALSEEATGGYKGYVFECLVRTDLARARKWLAQERTWNEKAANENSRYGRSWRLAEAERLAATDADEAINALLPIQVGYLFPALLKLSERFHKTDRERALRFAEEAVLQARTMDLPDRAGALARAADLVIRLGRNEAGKKLMDEAVALAEKLGTERRQGHERAQVVRYLASYDLPRALALLKPLRDSESTNYWLGNLADQLARTDAKTALALLDEMKPDRSFDRHETQLRIAWRVAARDPAEAARIAEGIAEEWYRGRALGLVAVGVAPRDQKLAWSLIDKGLDLCLSEPGALRTWSGGRSMMAAWIAAQSQVVGYPDMASVVARVLACRPTEPDEDSPTRVLETHVRVAKVLALIDPAAAQAMLDNVAPRQDVLGTGHSGFDRRDWFMARCLADPARAQPWVDELIAKLGEGKGRLDFYDSGLLQLAQVLTARPERRLHELMGLNSNLEFRDDD